VFLLKSFLQDFVKRVGVVISLIVASSLSVQAQVVFSPPVNLSNDTGASSNQQVAVDSKGNVNVVWLDNSSGYNVPLFSRSSDGGATFSAPLPISSHAGFNAAGLEMALDASGNIYVVWTDNSPGNSAVFFTSSSDGGATFSTPLNLSNDSGSATSPQIALDSSGDINIVWQDTTPGKSQILFTRSTDSGAGFSTVVNVSNNSDTESSPQIAVDSIGNINVVWADIGSANFAILYSRSADGGATFSATSAVDSVPITTDPYAPGNDGEVENPEVAVDQAGDINIIWTGIFYNGDFDDFYVGFSRSIDGGTTFSAPQQILGATGGPISPALAVGPDGEISVVSNTNPYAPDVEAIIVVLIQSVDGGITFTTPWTSGNCGTATNPQVAVDSSGKIDIVYAFSAGNQNCPTSGIFFVQSPDDNSFSTPQNVSGNVFVNSPVMSVDASGNVYVPWLETTSYSSSGGNVFFSQSPGASPFASLNLNPASVTPGASSTGRVTLTVAAPSGGAVISLSSSNTAVATVASSVTIPAGSNSATFTVSTSSTSPSTSVSITATYNGSDLVATLVVLPSAQIYQLTLNPANVVGGASSTGTVFLTFPAPSGGADVSLSSSNSLATVPSSVTIPAGSENATFTVNTNPDSASNSITISAAYNGITATGSLLIEPPPALSGVSLSRVNQVCGIPVTGTATLTSPAPSGGLVVTLSSSNPSLASVPASITIAAGSTSGNFTVSTSSVSTDTTVTISGTYNGVTMNASLIINPEAIAFEGLPANGQLTGGLSYTITASLDGPIPAPSGGMTEQLSSSNSSVMSVPPSVTVPAGFTSTTFTITTSSVSAPTSANLQASESYDGGVENGSIALTIEPPLTAFSSFYLTQSSVTGGASSTATVVLGAPAPSGGATILLSDSDWGVANIPSNPVMIAAGATTATFTVTTAAVTASTTVSITASYAGASQTVTLTIVPPTVTFTSASFNQVGATGGSSPTGTVLLTGPAPAGGIVVSLSSNNPAVASVPASVTVPQWSSTATFTITTTPVASPVSVTVTASTGSISATAALLTVTPPAPIFLGSDQSSVEGGGGCTGMVELNEPAPSGGAVVTLSNSNPRIVTTPATVTVPAGASIAYFAISTSPVAQSTSVTMTASSQGISQTMPLAVVP
jgi:hypothetical protein